MNASMILSFERDINDPLITFCPATLLARGDQNANIIKLTVMDGNAPTDLSGNTAVVLFQRPGDSYVVRCPGSVSGNVISVTLLGDCYLYAGQYYASLILDADGFTRTMLRLAGQIESNGDGPIIDPTGTIPGYEDIARIYAELEASLGRSDAATDSANAAAQNANEKAALANEAAGNANVAAGNANGATARANEASESIEGLTVEASDVSYDQPATATVTDVDGHKRIAFGLRHAFAVVLEKPLHLAVHPTLNYPRDTLANGYAAWAAAHGESPVFRPVNRIDKDTSGLVLAAKNSYAAPLLAE